MVDISQTIYTRRAQWLFIHVLSSTESVMSPAAVMPTGSVPAQPGNVLLPSVGYTPENAGSIDVWEGVLNLMGERVAHLKSKNSGTTPHDF